MRRVVIAISIVVAVFLIVILVGGIAVWRWHSSTLATPPDYASVVEIERHFQPQIQRLLAWTASEELQRESNWGYNPQDEALFSHPAILEVRFERPTSSGSSGRGFTDHEYRFQSRFTNQGKTPNVGEAVANRHFDTSPTGEKRTVVEYHRRMLDAAGHEINAFLLFDLDALSQSGP